MDGAGPVSPSELPECQSVEEKCPDIDVGGNSGQTGSGDDGSFNSGVPTTDGCNDSCGDASDGFCDDGGEGANVDICALGTDCADCGPRQ